MCAKLGEICYKPGRCFMWFVLEMTADSNNQWDLLQFMDLVGEAGKNYKCVCNLPCGRKGHFGRYLF